MSAIIDGPALVAYLGGHPSAELTDKIAAAVSSALAAVVDAPAEDTDPWPDGIVVAALSIGGRVYKDMTATGGSVQLDDGTDVEVFRITSNVLRRSEALYAPWRAVRSMLG